jgi:hypothetical protein
MKASIKKSTVAQGLDSSTFEQAAIVFAFTGFAVRAIGPNLHQFLAVLSPLTPALKFAAGIFPMASEAVRIGRARTLVMVEKYPTEAARLAIVCEARALFLECMRAMRVRDAAWGL